jgi:hypothetical protein
VGQCGSPASPRRLLWTGPTQIGQLEDAAALERRATENAATLQEWFDQTHLLTRGLLIRDLQARVN